MRDVVWPSSPLRGFSSLPPSPPAAPWCRCLVPCCGLLFVFCPGVRCCVVLLCRLLFRVLLFASFLAGGALLLRSRWLVPCVVACSCWVFVAGSCCPLFFSCGVLLRGCSCLTLPCAVVCCGVPLPCAVSCVLWCCVALSCRAVVPCCPFCFAGGFVLCPFPVSAVLCCAVRRAVRCRFYLCCCWCLAFWCVAVCGAVSVGVLCCGGAALLCGVVCRGVVLCRVVSCAAVLPCGALLLGCAVCFHISVAGPFSFPCCLVCWCGVLWCPAPCAVSCGAVLPYAAMLAGCAVQLSALLDFVFLLLFSNPLLKIPAVSPYL